MTLTTLQLSKPYGQLTYQDKGQGDPLVLIHGVGMESEVWRPQIKALSKEYRTFALDMPGHGGSSPLPHGADLPDFVEWLRIVIEALNLDTVNLCGHSMGALLASGFAISHPKKVARLAMLSGVFRRSASARMAVEDRAKQVSAGNFDPEAPLNRWFGDSQQEQEARQFVKGLFQNVNAEGYAIAYSAFARGDSVYADRFAHMPCPLLAMTGDIDLNSTPEMSQAMAEVAPNGKAVILKGHRHMINLTASELVTEELHKWLQTPLAAPNDMKPSHGKNHTLTSTQNGCEKLDRLALRDAFGTFMTGVTIVTALDDLGHPLGFTANSFTSVSLDPPLLLVCLSNTSYNYNAFTQASGFGINILSEGQKEISNIFARPVEDRFSTIDWKTGPHGSPILNDVSAWFDCSMHKTVEAGDHVILIGKIETFEALPALGLGYARGAYVSPAAEIRAMGHNTNIIISAIIEHQGQVLFLESGDGSLTLPETKIGNEGAPTALKNIIKKANVAAEPGFIYSIYDDEPHQTKHISFLCQAADSRAAGGVFMELNASTLARIKNPTTRTMLERFANENRVGNLGVYFGNETRGEIVPITSEAITSEGTDK